MAFGRKFLIYVYGIAFVCVMIGIYVWCYRRSIKVNLNQQQHALLNLENAKRDNVVNNVLNDFHRFPCLLDIPSSRGLVQNDTCVRTVLSNLDANKIITKCVPLKIMVTPPMTTPICVYEPKLDAFVSESILKFGSFEGGMVKDIMSVLLAHPQFEFLDLGCNIGTYTLTAAKLSKTMVSVDPLMENIRMLSKSLDIGNIRENVTLIWNAVSDHRSVVSFRKYKGNVGGTAIHLLDKAASSNLGDNDVARTILLDDITVLFKGKQIVIKMDVETQELAVLRCGQLFFKEVDVQLLQMEFNWHRTRPSGKEIIDILGERGLEPFRDPFGKQKLDKTKYSNWPGDVYFIKQ